MAEHPVYRMAFSKVYPLLVQKAERKGRTQAEVDEVICWLTGYDHAGLQSQIAKEVDIATFYAEAPQMHPNRDLIKGVVCGVRVETIDCIRNCIQRIFCKKRTEITCFCLSQA